MWNKCYGAGIEMDAERFPYRNTPLRASFYRVVNLFELTKKKQEM